MGIRAFRFHYIGNEAIETFPFYRKYIRGFLRWHRGDAVWVKGGIGKRDAHIIVKEWLVPNLFRMMKDVNLKYGGKFGVKEVNSHYIIYEAKELDRETVGYLRDGNVELGNSDEISCPKENYRKMSVQDWCWGRERGARCDAWDGQRCIYPKMTKKAMEEREARITFMVGSFR